jgi:hypothetical protein
MNSLSQKSQQVLGEWLNEFDWMYWCTFTTKNTMTLQSARRMAQGMDKYLSGAYHWKMFWCAEPFDIKEGHHLHALIQMSDVHAFEKIKGTWQAVSGAKWIEEGKKENRCQIQMYDKKLGAGHYVSKYITKELADYDFYDKRTYTKI